jgi:hypothetical protein
MSISRWRVPREWGDYGRYPYAILFGLSLGAGVLTATSSVGFYVVACWLLSAPAAAAFVVAVAFALARAVMPIAVAVDSGGLSARSCAADRLASVSGRWTTPVERIALIAFAVTALAATL